MGDFLNEDGCANLDDANAGTDNGTATDPHARVDRECIDDTTNEHQQHADNDGPATTPAVGDIVSDVGCDSRRKKVRGTVET